VFARTEILPSMAMKRAALSVAIGVFTRDLVPEFLR
jgi:hypothetical protein